MGIDSRYYQSLKSMIVVLLFLFSISTGITQNFELEQNKTMSSSSQNTVFWGETVSGNQGNDFVESIDLDANGNTYVCGNYEGNTHFGNFTLNTASENGYVGKIDQQGNWLWVEDIGGSNPAFCWDLDADDGGNISITGTFDNSANFGSIQLSSYGSYDIFVAKLDTNGNWLWAKNGGSTDGDQGKGVAIDGSGNVYVTGHYFGTCHMGSNTLSHQDGEDWFIAKLDTNGNWVWSTRMYGNYYDVGEAIDVNTNGDIAVVGYSSYDIYVGTFGWQYPNYRSNTGSRVFVATLDNGGTFTSGSYLGSHTNYNSYAEDVVIDDSGVVTLSGRMDTRLSWQGSWKYSSGSSDWDCFVASYAYNPNNSTPLAEMNFLSIGGQGADYCWSIDRDDRNGELIVSGDFNNVGNAGSFSISSHGGIDAFFATLTPNASSFDVNMAHTFGANDNDHGKASAIHNGLIVFAGTFGASGYDDQNTINLAGTGYTDGWIISYGSDSDGDGFTDPSDAFPNDPSQWIDSDGDGFGDNASGFQGDDCPDLFGNSTASGYFGCLDSDGDSWANDYDDLPDEKTQWEDTDNDGYGDNLSGNSPDSCPTIWGNSTRDRFGCTDIDGDGQSDMNDSFSNESTQWEDTDGDGFGDNISGFQGDACPESSGDSWRNLIGCPDSDGDGWADEEDAVPSNPTQHEDSDGDGFGDDVNGTEADACPSRHGNSTTDRYGCPDNDGDGISNDADDCPTVLGVIPNGCPDSDGDGYVDEAEESNSPVDDCPNQPGTSSLDKFGCPDSDQDGYSDEGDSFANDSTQWSDTDGDGYGDNPNGTNPDYCPESDGNSTMVTLGCVDIDGDGYADDMDLFPQNSLAWSDSDGDGFADQPGTDLTDDCINEAGNSTGFLLGCPDLDGDGAADTWDDDIDGDGFSNIDEANAIPPTDPYDATSFPEVDNSDQETEGDSQNNALGETEGGFNDMPLIALLILLLVIAGNIGMKLSNRSKARKLFEKLEDNLASVNDFDGLSSFEGELDDALKTNSIPASQGVYLRNRVEKMRTKFQEELQASQYAEWWAQVSHQQQQAGWSQSDGQAHWGHEQQGQ